MECEIIDCEVAPVPKADVDCAPPAKKHKSDNKSVTDTDDVQGAPPEKKHKSDKQPESKSMAINEYTFVQRGYTVAGLTRCYHHASRHHHEHYTQYLLLNVQHRHCSILILNSADMELLITNPRT